MLKQHVIFAILLLMFSATTFTGCSSSDDKADNIEATETSADLGADEFSLDGEFSNEAFSEGDFSADLGEGEADPFASPEGGDDPFAVSDTEDPFASEAPAADDPFAAPADDPFAAEDNTSTAATDDPFAADPFSSDSMEELPADNMAMEESAPADPFASDSAPADPFASDSLAMEEPAPIQDMTSDLGGSATLVDDTGEESVGWIPVKKMMTEPYRKNGVLVNTIYIARPGDDIQKISQKIYGQDRTEELLMVSSWLRNGIDVGDKLYYNSPNRPNDDSRIITYYEDVGLQPETYITQPGDNIRQVAERLLGHSDSWKEIWATNMDVESKMEVQEGLSLRYWTGEGATPQMPSMATTEPANQMPPMGDMNNEMPIVDDTPSDMAMNDMPPMEEAPGMGMNEMPPMEEAPEMAMNDMPPPTMEPPAMNPPPVAETTPPPAPERPARASAEQGMAEEGGQDQMLMLGLAVILLIAGIALFIIRKKRSAEAIDFNTSTHTQIE